MAIFYKFLKFIFYLFIFIAFSIGVLKLNLYYHHQVFKGKDYVLEEKIVLALEINTKSTVGDVIGLNGNKFCLFFPSSKNILDFTPFNKMNNEDKNDIERVALKSIFAGGEYQRWLEILDENYKLLGFFKINHNLINHSSFMNKKQLNGFYYFDRNDDINKMFYIDKMYYINKN